MNTNDMHKREIAGIYWPDGAEQGANLTKSDKIHLEMSATHHGDHDEFWIVEYAKENDGLREVARHNPRYVETIVWA
jgi:hypothetical protein